MHLPKFSKRSLPISSRKSSGTSMKSVLGVFQLVLDIGSLIFLVNLIGLFENFWCCGGQVFFNQEALLEEWTNCVASAKFQRLITLPESTNVVTVVLPIFDGMFRSSVCWPFFLMISITLPSFRAASLLLHKIDQVFNWTGFWLANPFAKPQLLHRLPWAVYFSLMSCWPGEITILWVRNGCSGTCLGRV